MEWLNYHHLRYFWIAATEGNLARAAKKLHVSQPAISEQIRQLEDALGEKLFRREGRSNKLTDAGQIVLGFAEDIFALGGEMLNAVKQRPNAKTPRLHVGLVDSFPKLVTNELLRPVFDELGAVRVLCREGKLDDLLAQLAVHRLDIILADEPASSGVNFRAFSHLLGETDTTICAEPALARRLKRGFPGSLQDAPALLPSENTPFRRALENWFRSLDLRPRVVAEFDDLALMKVMATEGRGFIAVPTVAMHEAEGRYGFGVVGRARDCRIRLHAITAERRIVHPAVAVLTAKARSGIFARANRP
jgi:LysR family transcriptional activator of nhaA